MSYDLNFWREKPGVKLDPQAVYEMFCDGEEAVEGLENISGNLFIKKLAKSFNTWTREGDGDWVSKDSMSSIQVTYNTQWIRVDCRGDVSSKDMNAIIQIANDMGCALYDPQVPERFHQPPKKQIYIAGMRL